MVTLLVFFLQNMLDDAYYPKKWVIHKSQVTVRTQQGTTSRAVFLEPAGCYNEIQHMRGNSDRFWMVLFDSKTLWHIKLNQIYWLGLWWEHGIYAVWHKYNG